ncbi:MAG: hypothetical protein ACTSPV_16645 [Candidatus Hodarchaeales archaeon]
MVTKDEFIEDFGVKNNYWILENFQSTEQINTAVTQTAVINPLLHEFTLRTGVQEGSEARAYYERNIFNPVYAKALFRLYMNDMKDCFAFFGFKQSNSAPTYNMAESHVGFMVNDGVLYFSSARDDVDNPGQQRQPIVNIDIEEQLGLPVVVPVTRKWSQPLTNGTYPPEDRMHHLLFYIKNNVGKDKYLRVRKLVYWEDYAD